MQGAVVHGQPGSQRLQTCELPHLLHIVPQTTLEQSNGLVG